MSSGGLLTSWYDGSTCGQKQGSSLIVQGEKDRLFPVEMARALAAASGAGCEFVVVPELSHNDPIYRPQQLYWSAIGARLLG